MPLLLDALRRLTPEGKSVVRKWGRQLLGVDFVTVPGLRSSPWPYELNATYARRFLHFRDLLLRLEDVEGQIVECGVGPGRSLFVFAVLTQCVARARRIVGFDTFEGLPEPTVEDGHGAAHKSGWFSHSEADVCELLQFNGVAKDFIDQNISFVQGTLAESLPSYGGGAIALLHLDVDLYESYKTALDWLWPFVSPGGIVTFDEYRSDNFPGATRAIDEFLAKWQLEVVQSRYLDRWYVVKAAN